MVHPGTSALGTFVERVPLGRTRFKPKEVLAILQSMRKSTEWLGCEYNVLRRNCAHFSVELVKRLRVNEAPKWVNSLASVGDKLVNALGQDEAEEAAERATPPLNQRLPPPMAMLDDDDEEASLASGSDLKMREMAWQRSKDYVLERATAFENSNRFLDLTVDFRWGSASSDAQNKLKSTMLHVSSFRRAVVASTLKGMRRKANIEIFADSDDEEEMEPEGDEHEQEEKMDIAWMKTWPGSMVRCKLRLQSAYDDEDWPPEMPDAKDFAARFETEIHRIGKLSLANQEWPAGGTRLVSTVECVSTPGKAAFGERVECAGGGYLEVVHGRGFEDSSIQRSTQNDIIITKNRLQQLLDSTSTRQMAAQRALRSR